MSDPDTEMSVYTCNDQPSPDVQVWLSRAAPSEVSRRLTEAVRRAGGAGVVCRKSGVAQRNLNRYLHGFEPKVSTLVALAYGCGVSVEWLACGAEKNAALSQNPLSGSEDSIAPIPEHEIDYDQVSRIIEQVEKMVATMNLRLSTEQAADIVQRLYALSHVPPKPV